MNDTPDGEGITMPTPADYGDLHKLFDTNFLDYTSYVIRERAIPDVDDGLKPVQRRILQTLINMDDGRFHKVANVVGETMKLHPHGDASIFAALVNLANREYFIDRQGNFGNIYTGDQASAARYIECRLTPLARETLFNRELTEFVDSYDGRMQEPVTFPAKLPVLLLLGTEGIAVGMATKILPHNFFELLEAQKNILRNEPFEIVPDFQTGGIMDASGYAGGNGRIRCRARIEEKNEKTITITEIPYGTTTQSLIESIEKAARNGKIKIHSIADYTAEQVEIEIKLARGTYAKDTIQALYAFTDCEVPISPNLTVIRDNRPVVMTVDEVLRHNTVKLTQDLERELSIELGKLKEKLHAHLLEQIFIEERLYKQIEECLNYDTVLKTVAEALAPFAENLVREVTRDDIERLLEIRIKRISRYDINKKKKDIKEVRTEIKEVETSLKDMIGFTIRFLDDLLARFGGLYPRRTEIISFEGVVVREVAPSNLTMVYSRNSGFLGTQIKDEPEIYFSCSEYDKILLIQKNGVYKVVPSPEKLFVGHDVIWVGKVEPDITFNCIYREGREGYFYLKRFQTPKFIMEKEYNLFPAHERSSIHYFSLGAGSRIKVQLVPSGRAASNIVIVAFDEHQVKGASALGKRITNRPVRRIVEMPPGEEPGVRKPATPGLFGGEGDKGNTSETMPTPLVDKVTS